jgi:hypothetical protein
MGYLIPWQSLEERIGAFYPKADKGATLTRCQ